MEWLRRIAAHVDRAEPRHIAGLLLHTGQHCAAVGLRAGSGRPGEHKVSVIANNKD